MRSIVAIGRYVPAWVAGGRPCEGPDEDELTLAVGAAESLAVDPGEGPTWSDLHWVGAGPEAAGWALPEVLGVPHLPLHRHVGGPGGVARALAAAASAPGGPGPALVVVPERASRPRGPEGAAGPGFGASALAFLLDARPGLRPLSSGGRQHPAGKWPDASAWVEAFRAAASLPAGSTPGRLILRAPQAPPVLLASIRRAFPGASVESGPDPEGPSAVGPGIAEALTVAELARPAAGAGTVAFARVAPEATVFAGFERTGPVELTGGTSGPSDPGGGRLAPSIEVDATRAVSEGAYVPAPRYRENLASRWRLEGVRCSACGALTFPARATCRRCRASDQLRTERLPREGTVAAVTTIAPGAQPTEFDPLVAARGSYDVVLVEFFEGVRLTLQVADAAAGSVHVGDRVGTTFRRLYPMDGEWRYGRKALPSTTPAAAR